MSSSSSQTSGSTSTSVGILPTPSFAQFISVKLTRDNYLLWKAQVVPYLRSHRLIDYIDGSVRPSPGTIVIAANGEAAESVIPNPDFTDWIHKDQVVMSALLSSLSEEVLGHVLFLTTASEVWNALENMFASRSRARMIQVRVQLANIKKKEMPAADYFHKVKNLADTMAAIGHPLRDDEIVSYILIGLGPDYESLVTSITTRSDPISVNDLYGYLMSFEARVLENNAGHQFSSSANQVSRGYQGGRGGSDGGCDRGRDGRGGRGPPQGRGNGGNRDNNNNRDRPPLPICQICNKRGHDALRCYHRYNDTYQPEDHHYNNTYQPKDRSAKAYQVDTNWYADSGATDHITSDLDRLTLKERYDGSDQVQVASGSNHEEGSSSRQV